MVYLTIVIPFYNEQESLQELLPSLLDVLSGLNKTYEVLCVDDGSADASADVVRDYQAKDKQLTLIQNPKRSGQTECYRRAFELAQGEYLVRMDADLQDDPRDLPLFIAKFDAGSELVVGLREVRKHRRLLRLASGIYDLLIVLLFNSPLHSNSGSYVGFKTSLVKDIPFRKNDHRYLPLIAMKRGARNIGEVLVRHTPRKYGKSKYGAYKKIVLGVPEVILFLARYEFGVYDIHPN